MDFESEEILAEDGIRSTCFKAGKLASSREHITCDLFEKLVVQSTKLPSIECNCPSLLQIEEYPSIFRYYFVVTVIAHFGHCFLCNFSVEFPQEEHSEFSSIETEVDAIEWKVDKTITSFYRYDFDEE